ncbi:MAG: nucleotidyltransferase family protein [Anaerolineae bacterium]|nr:nucleotidyltransferase family protein [Anaerolineae bacterium]
MTPKIAIPQNEITAFCQRNHIHKLSLFGSALRDDFNPDSDLDLLVEFEPDHVPGFITFSKMRLELSELLGRQVDLQTPPSLSRYFREDVEERAEKIYSAY